MKNDRPCQGAAQNREGRLLKANWHWIGPNLVGKLHVYTGDMDNDYLNLGVELIEEFLENTKDPYYDGVVE